MGLKRLIIKMVFSALLMSFFVQIGILSPARTFFDNFIAAIILSVVTLFLGQIFG